MPDYNLSGLKPFNQEPPSAEMRQRFDVAMQRICNELDLDPDNPDSGKVLDLMRERHPDLMEAMEVQLIREGLEHVIEDFMGEMLIDGPPED